jgi:5'-3' exonuclease
MGVLEFFGTLIRNEITASAITSACQVKTPIDHFLVDFNSIIHVASEKINLDLNVLLRLMMKALFTKQQIKGYIYDEFFEKYHLNKLKIDLESKPKITPEEMIALFHSHLGEKKLDTLVITQVIQDLYMVLKKFLDRPQLKTILLAIDGVPSKGKLIEQKQRRYMGTIIGDYKAKITEKFKAYLELQGNYLWLVESNPISWSRNKITPGTLFMHKMIKNLKHSSMKDKLFKFFPNLQHYIVSSMYEIGEGEKKLVNYVLDNLVDTKDSVMFYSPDADMILLAMLVPVDNMFVLRHNKQSACYDLINIKLLKENISYYINTASNSNYLVSRINYDLVCLSSIFGNDFVPKIETLNVKQGFQLLMDVYTQTLLKLNNKYLVILDPKDLVHPFKLDLDFLRQMLSALKPEEDDFVTDNKLYHQYLNYSKFKYVFPDTIITNDNIVGLYQGLRQSYEYLKNSIKNGSNLNKFIYDEELIAYLKKSLNVVLDTVAVNTTYLTGHQFVALLKQVYMKTNDFPRINFNLNTASHSIRDNHHKFKTVGMNDYDKELYKFEKMLDEYHVKFNASPLDLSGPISIKKYYDTYFHDDIPTVCGKYIEGMLWVFNYYFNDKDYLNHWFYPYERAPLIRDLLAYSIKLTHKDFDKLFNDLASYKVSNIKDYFNPVEQLMYVSPLTNSMLKLLPSAYANYLSDRNNLNPFLKDYFLDIKEVVRELWNSKSLDNIDCHSIVFLNKCQLKSMKRYSTDDDITFIGIFRSIPISAISKKRTKSAEPDF